MAEQGGPFAEMVMFDLLNVSEAWRLLHDPQVTRHLNTEEYFNLCRAAGHSKKESERMANQWALQRLRKDMPM